MIAPLLAAAPKQRLGRSNGRAKLTEADVRTIRARYVWYCPVNGSKAIARDYGMGKESIRLIVIGVNWPHLQQSEAA